MIRSARESRRERGVEGSRRSVSASLPSEESTVEALEKKDSRGLKLQVVGHEVSGRRETGN